MARIPEFNFRRESSLVRDKEREPYNGYITTTVSSVDKPNVVSWSLFNGRVRFGPVEAGIIFITICVVWLLFASVPETWLLGLCGLLQQTMAMFLPLVCLVCVFYWAELLVQKYCKTRVSLAVFPICAVGEFSTHVLFDGVIFDSSDFLRTSFLFTLILAGLVSVMFHRLNLIPSSVILLILTISRMCCWLTSYEIHSWFGPILAYISAFAGLILSRNVQGIFTQTPTEVESKVPIIRRTRRSSSVSSTSSLSSRRRTSLPALGIQNKGLVDYTTLGEAHGMISDLLADSNLPPNVASTLKLISTMIAPPTAFHSGQGPFINRMSPLVERFRHESLEDKDKVKDQPDLKDDMTLPMIGRLRRSMASSGRRMSSTYTTTTSATGMPTVDPDLTPTMLRAPSVSLNEISSVSSGNSPRLPLNLSLESTQPNSRAQENFSKHKPYLTHNYPLQGRKSSPDSPNLGRKSPDRQPPSPNLKRRSSDRPSLYSPRLSREDIKEDLENKDDDVITENEERVSCEKSNCSCICHGRKRTSNSGVTETNEKTGLATEPEKFELPRNEEITRIMDKITDWNFPIFDACEHGHVLVQVAYRIFRNVGFFETFKIPERKFLNYFFTLESGYHDIPYHNSIHASDVLHGVYYMTTAKIPGFCPPGTPSQKMDNDSDSDSDSGITSGVLGEGEEEKKEEEEGDDDYGTLFGTIPLLELLALYTAAAMHDYDHPGRTNAFLVATLSRQALLYNDRSVLENHHAAAAFTLLMSDPKFNFLCELSPSEFKRFRFLSIEAILATDLKRHFDILSDFNAKTAEGGVNWDSEADRLLTLQFCIKMSDISGPSKRRDIHTLWTERIVEEFYEQGDDERERGMAVSPYMDRNQPHVAQLQDSFINHLVAPLYNSYANAGLIPGTWVEEEESSPDTESDANDSEDEGPPTSEDDRPEKPKKKKTRRRKRRKVVSEITVNIQRNYKMWRQRVKETEREHAKSVHEEELANEEDIDDDAEEDTTGIIITETSIRDDTIEEEENGSECSSTTTDSRKDADV